MIKLMNCRWHENRALGGFLIACSSTEKATSKSHYFVVPLFVATTPKLPDENEKDDAHLKILAAVI